MKRLLVIGAVLLNAGCASIVSGVNQSVSVEARTERGPVLGVPCKLENDKGAWLVMAPGSVTVQRSITDLLVVCEKEGFPVGQVTALSATKGMAFGNIMFGGLLGVGVDVATGAAYDYATMITVMLGKSSTLAGPVLGEGPEMAVPCDRTAYRGYECDQKPVKALPPASAPASAASAAR